MTVDEQQIDDVAAATLAAVEQFRDAVDRRDGAALADAITPDCVFESPGAPDGRRYVGSAIVNAFVELFAVPGEGPFVVEEVIVAGDRAVVRWVHSWNHGGEAGHVRGIDVFRARDGAIAEKLSYVKG